MISSARPLITLLTDFGTQDAYVASMKGVILTLNPEVILVDLSHDVPRQDIQAGALILAAAASYFPPGTIHLAVVDPGVGGPRRGLAARCQGHFWVGPDNGLFHLIFRGTSSVSIVSLQNPDYFHFPLSPTFHGRDIFAPVASHLSLGVDLSRFGPRITDPVYLHWPEASFGPEAVRGEIIYVDQFGNLITNIHTSQFSSWSKHRDVCVKIGPLTIHGLARTYSNVAPGEFLALVGSHGFLEVACFMDNAARRLGAATGLTVEVRNCKDVRE